MHAQGIPNRWPFVAREAELGVLSDVLDQGAAGEAESTGAVIVAPAGVGKSRLLREVGRLARERGLTTRLAVATRSAATTPYGPIASLLERSAPGGDEDLGTWYRYVAETLRAGSRHRLVLLIDDAQLLDEGSASLVLHLALTGAAIVVATIRRFEPVPDPITALWKDGLALRVDLQPFSVPEVEALIRVALDDQVSRHTSRRLAQTSAGNVLFAHELVLGAAAAGSLAYRDGAWRWNGDVDLAPRLVDAVGLRLQELSPEDLEAVALLAIGEPLSVALSGRLIDVTIAARLENLGLMVVSDGPAAQCRLAHPLYGEVALSRVGQITTRKLKQVLADALESDLSDGAIHDVVRIATWRLEAGGRPSTTSLVRAATHANHAFDYRLAERLARAALERKTDPSAVTALAVALCQQSRFVEAEETLAAAEEEILANVDAGLHRAYVDCRHQALYMGLGDAAKDSAMLDRFLLAHVDADRGHRRAAEHHVAGYRAQILIDRGDLTEALKAAEEPLQADDVEPLSLLHALETAGEARAYAGDLDGARMLHLRLHELGQSGVPEVGRANSSAAMQEVMCQVLEGRLDVAVPFVASVHEQMINHPDREQRSLTSLVYGASQLSQGTLGSARRSLMDAVAGYGDLNIGGTLAWAHMLVAQVDALTGDVESATTHLETARSAHAQRPVMRMRLDLLRAEVLVRMAAGDVQGAAQDALQRAEELIMIPPHQIQLLHLAARLGAPAEALKVLDRQPTRMAGDYPDLVHRHARALVEKDAVALSQVGTELDAWSQWLIAAEAHTSAAMEFHRRGDRGAATRSAATASALAARCQGAQTPGLRLHLALPRLSRREGEVARLAARGLSNVDIAERLVLSVRTVESHLYQAYAKLGVEQRSELAGVLGDI